MKKNNNIKIMGVFATVLLLVIVITASFAYFGSFNVNLNNNVAVNVNSVSPGDATFTSNATQLNLQVPAANMSQTVADNSTAAASNTATLTVNLTGAANLLTTCTYDIVYEYDDSSYIYGGTGTNHVAKNGDKEITLQVSGVNGTINFAREKNFDYDSNWSGLKRTLVSGATIESMGTLTTQNISIIGKYYNLTISQSSLEGKAFTGKIYVTNHSCSTSDLPGYYTILANSKVNETTPNFASTATTNEGLYKAQDDLGTSYYFRGAVNNNWVKFGQENGKDIYWRIIRINGDGSIRMIYSGTTKPESSTATVMTGTGTQINATTYVFNSSGNKAEYVGYMYTEGEQHGNSTPSAIKTTIENWYAGTTLKDNNLVSQDQIFCNDRSAGSTQTAAWTSTGATYYYGARDRLNTNKAPILTCPEESDKFTSKDSSVGNKKLEYPVGLITADEVAMAGGVYNTTNSSYYLYTNQYYWLGSPSNFNFNGAAIEFNVNSSGPLSYSFVYTKYGTRPVVSLSSKAKLSGNGTYSNPYTVS